MSDIAHKPAPPEADDLEVAAAPGDGELVLGGEACALLTHAAVISKARDGMVIVRVRGKGETSAHVGTSPRRAMRLGARFIQAAIHADPSLLNEFDALIASARACGGKTLRVVTPEQPSRSDGVANGVNNGVDHDAEKGA